MKPSTTWSPHRTAAAALVLITTATGCGEALVPGELTETPIFTVRGTVIGADHPSSLRVSALWVDPFAQRDDWPPPRTHAVGTLEPAGDFRLDFFRPPPAEVIRHVASSTNPAQTVFAFAFAEIVAYEDRNGDGAFAVEPLAAGANIVAPDVYRAVAGTATSGAAIFYVATRRTEGDNVLPELDPILMLAPGYHQAEVNCTSPPSVATVAPPATEGESVMITLVPPTAALPETRYCLRSHSPDLAPP